MSCRHTCLQRVVVKAVKYVAKKVVSGVKKVYNAVTSYERRFVQNPVGTIRQSYTTARNYASQGVRYVGNQIYQGAQATGNWMMSKAQQAQVAYQRMKIATSEGWQEARKQFDVRYRKVCESATKAKNTLKEVGKGALAGFANTLSGSNPGTWSYEIYSNTKVYLDLSNGERTNAYTLGEILAKLTSMGLGALGTVSGATAFVGSGAATIFSGGTASAVSVPAAAGSLAVMTGSGTIAIVSANNLGLSLKKLEFNNGGWSGSVEKMGPTKGNTPGSNQAQNKQVRDIVTKLKLNKKQQRQLHDEITGQGCSY